MSSPKLEKIESIIRDKSNETSYLIGTEYILKFLSWMVGKGYSYRTRSEYQRYTLALLESPYIISISRINTFLNSKSKTDGLIKQAAVKCFLRFLLVEYNIDFPRIDYSRNKPNIKLKKPAPTREEVIKIVEQFKKEGLLDYSLFIKFVFLSGSRIGESLKLKICDLEWDLWEKNESKSGIVNFLDTKGKKDEQVPIPPSLMLELKKYIIRKFGEVSKNDERLLFNFNFERVYERNLKRLRKEKIDPDGANKEELDEERLAEYVKCASSEVQAQLKLISNKAIGRGITPHALRSARAVDLDLKGLPISMIRDFLRHKNVSTTSSYLTHSLKALEKELTKKDDFWN